MRIRTTSHRSRMRLAAVSTCVTAASAALIGLSGAAHAVSVMGEGTAGDTANATAAAVSDASAVDAFTVVDSATANCSGGFTSPHLRPSGAGTGFDVFAQLVLDCQGYNGVDLDFDLQRHRWWGWQHLAGTSVSKYQRDYRGTHTVTTSCRAGTWSYRSEVVGYIDGRYVNNHSTSQRYTCVDRTNIDYIDLS